MNGRRELISDAFHALAQPVMALRATVELGLRNATDGVSLRQTLEECLGLITRLTSDIAIIREITNLDEAPPLKSCDGKPLLQRCVDELEAVAQAHGIALKLRAEAANIQCNDPMLQRAMFVLLDGMIASSPEGGEISISFGKGGDGPLLEVCPGAMEGPRKELCRKLMQFAGGRGIRSESSCTSITFRESQS